MKKLLIYMIGFFTIVSFSLTGFASRNSITNVRALQRSDGSHYVDIYYDLAAVDPRICEVRYSIDGGLTFIDSINSLSGEMGENVSSGHDKHIIWDAGSTLPDVNTECKIRIIVTFWVGYPRIPLRLTKSVPDKDAGKKQAESLLQLAVSPDSIDNNHSVNQQSSNTIVEYFLKRACYRIVRQSDTPPFILNTMSDKPDVLEIRDAPLEPVLPVHTTSTQLGHAPTLDEWGMIVFFILLVTVSVSKLRSSHPHS